jgi:hypothetical protein
MPGQMNKEATNNYFSFSKGPVFFFSVNFDYIFSTYP